MDDIPLKDEFLIYVALHAEERTQNGLELSFRRHFEDWDIEDVSAPTKLEGDRIYMEPDKLIWTDNNSGLYSVKSGYSRLT